MTLLDRALYFAIEKHSGQIRRKTATPYILHPLEAAAIAGTMTSDESILAAAVLHDTIEDADVDPAEILQNFGPRVTELVLSETEDKHADRPPEETWRLRKEDSLAVLKTTKDPAVKIIWLSDKLSNVRSFYRDYLVRGDALWNNFHQKDPAVQAWYYRTIASYLSDLKEYDAYSEYVRLVGIIFQNIKNGENE